MDNIERMALLEKLESLFRKIRKARSILSPLRHDRTVAAAIAALDGAA
jgi:hypothetical protein